MAKYCELRGKRTPTRQKSGSFSRLSSWRDQHEMALKSLHHLLGSPPTRAKTLVFSSFTISAIGRCVVSEKNEIESECAMLATIIIIIGRTDNFTHMWSKYPHFETSSSSISNYSTITIQFSSARDHETGKRTHHGHTLIF